MSLLSATPQTKPPNKGHTRMTNSTHALSTATAETETETETPEA